MVSIYELSDMNSFISTLSFSTLLDKNFEHVLRKAPLLKCTCSLFRALVTVISTNGNVARFLAVNLSRQFPTRGSYVSKLMLVASFVILTLPLSSASWLIDLGFVWDCWGSHEMKDSKPFLHTSLIQDHPCHFQIILLPSQLCQTGSQGAFFFWCLWYFVA